MAAFARPENALKRADDLIAVGQKDHALQTLHDIITSKRHRTWSKVLEDIMKKYIQLCVDMRKGMFAKEGLHQYKNICQQVNVNSLEVVIKHYLNIAEACAKEAQSKAKQTILDIEDLEAEESAESIILTAVSGEDRTDRTDREIVTPWLRFLWETYRTVLETLRNSAKLESLYHETARLAFNFCLRYERKNEFRRLSDILRNHLTNLGKYPNQPQSITLSNPETLQIHLQTRFSQLNVATKLELWQEAFRSVEDIHGLMTMAHKPLTGQMMSTYFSQLARIFWVSNNYLFHAYAWFKYFSIARTSLKDKPEEFKTIASSVLLAALSIPLPDPKPADEQYFEYDPQKEKNLRMGTLLGFTITPKRDSLLQDLASKKITQMVFPELADIYAILEKQFDPLHICQKMEQKFAFIRLNPELAQYEEQLQKLTFLRLVQQLSQVYESMKIADFKKMVTFMDSHAIEKLLVNIVKRRFAGVRIDHQNSAIHFGTGQDSDQIRDQLTQLAKGLQQASKMIHPRQQDDVAYTKGKGEIFVRIINSLKDEALRYKARRASIEARRVAEEEAAKKALEEKKRQEQKIVDNQIKLEAKRFQQEQQKRQKQMEKVQQQETVKSSKISMLGNLGVDPQVAATIQDPDSYIQAQLNALVEKKKAQEAKLITLAKDLSHKERAQRENEKILLEQQLERKRVEDRDHFESLLEKSIAAQRTQHTVELAEKKRLARMATARFAFEERVMAARTAEYNKLKAAQDARLEEMRARMEEEKQRIEKEEEEQRRKLEEERREAEEREREKKRVEDQKKAEEEAKRKKLAEQAELQRKREEEVTRRRLEDEEAARKKKEEEERERRDSDRKEGPWKSTSWKKEDSRRDDGLRKDVREDRPAEVSWRKDERREDQPQRRDDYPPRREDSRRDDYPPRREDSRRDDFPPRREDSRRDDYPPRRDESRREDLRRDDYPPRRDEPRREESRRDDTWRRDEPRRDEPRREDSRWRRDEPRREDSRRDEPRRDEPRREDSRRDDTWRRGPEPRREESRRDEPRRDDRPRDDRREDKLRDEPRREDSRRDEPRRDEGPWRREDTAAAERPSSWRREESRTDNKSDRPWGRREDSDKARPEEKREPERREVERPERREPERREPERKESERRVDTREKEPEKPARKEEESESPKDEGKGLKEKEASTDGFSVVAGGRRRRK